jgi:hypothetical protein
LSDLSNIILLFSFERLLWRKRNGVLYSVLKGDETVSEKEEECSLSAITITGYCMQNLVARNFCFVEMDTAFRNRNTFLYRSISGLQLDPLLRDSDHPIIFEVTIATNGPTTLSIDPASLFSDTGEPATVLPALSTENSSYEVFIKGCCKWRI